MNTMTINGYQAVIAFDPDIQMFRGEFVSLNGGADFYAADVEGLKHASVAASNRASTSRASSPCGLTLQPTKPPPSPPPRTARA